MLAVFKQQMDVMSFAVPLQLNNICKSFKLFRLGSETSFNLTPSEPQYFLFTFPEDVDSVYVKTTSPDNLLFGNLSNGFDAWGNNGDGLSQFASQFFVVLVLKPNDVECNGPAKIIPINRTYF
ncbi:unnamed protein product [Schistocephalus solidus]|uniref:Uncharacterized protein n=1 Tax=Schistocephalus solidus TaxID=70667 RepID=A0A3P7BYP6_SCHSO|nr:unnamed protein product [Schistocephalus solidus]